MTYGPVAGVNVEGAATALLTTLVEAMTAIAEATEWVTNWSPPARQVYQPGSNVAWDGEQLVLNFMGMRPGMPGRETTQPILPVNILLYYDFEVTILRPVAALTGRGGQGGFPSVKKQAASSSDIETDNLLLMAALVQMHHQGAIVPVGIPFLYGSVDTVGPQGALAGSHVSVSFQAGVAPYPAGY